MIFVVNNLSNDVLYPEEIDVIASAIEDLVFPEPNIFDEKIAALSVHAIDRKNMAKIAERMTHVCAGEDKNDTAELINRSIAESGKVAFLKNDVVGEDLKKIFYASWFNISAFLIQQLDSGKVDCASVFVPPDNNSRQYYVEAGINCEDDGCVLIFAYIYSGEKELCSKLNEGIYGLCCVIKKILMDDSLDIRSTEIVDKITATAIERRVKTWFTKENYAIDSWRKLLEKLSQEQDKESK